MEETALMETLCREILSLYSYKPAGVQIKTDYLDYPSERDLPFVDAGPVSISIYIVNYVDFKPKITERTIEQNAEFLSEMFDGSRKKLINATLHLFPAEGRGTDYQEIYEFIEKENISYNDEQMSKNEKSISELFKKLDRTNVKKLFDKYK